MRKIVWGALCLGLGASGLYWMRSQSEIEPPQAKATESGPSDSVERDDVRALHDEVSRLRAELRSMASKEAAPESTPTDAEVVQAKVSIPANPISRSGHSIKNRSEATAGLCCLVD